MAEQEGFRHFRELVVWKKAMDLVVDVYKLTSRFPDSERFGLISQLRRAAVSIPSNIAEGQGRCTTGEFKQFLGQARGSLCEIDTQIEIASRLGFTSPQDAYPLTKAIEDVARLLNALIRSLRERHSAREEDAEYE